MTRICIVSPFAYGALTGGDRGHAGGVEQQTSMLARWLARRGHEVSLVTWDEGQPDGEIIDGVRVLITCRRDAGRRFIRFIYPRWAGLNRAMNRADADVYYQNCGDYFAGQVAAFCRVKKRPFLYSVASDPDCDRRLPKLHAIRERVLYRFGIRRANRIIVQTHRQREMLRENFDLESVVIPMPSALGPEGQALTRPAPPAVPRMAWVGRIAPVKRLEVLLDVAEQLPNVQFEIAGQPDVYNDYSRGLLERVRHLTNVTMHGLVSRRHMPILYRGATALLCTWEFEGFPNTFLEAWTFGTPVISTIDPDSVFSRHGVGTHVNSADEMAAAIRRLLASPALWLELSQRGINYVATHHDPERALTAFERELLSLVDSKPTAGA